MIGINKKIIGIFKEKKELVKISGKAAKRHEAI